jgi:hypothetical protein
MTIENINEFSQRTNTSKSTIYRFYKKNEDLWAETVIKYRKRRFPIEHAKYFDSVIMFEENKLLRIENKSMKNLIDCLANKESSANFYWHMEWSFFVTVAYKAERNRKSCFKKMHALYNELNAKYGNDAEVRVLFTTEPFANRKGYHNHMLLYLSNDKLHQAIKTEIADFFSFDRVDFQPYDKCKAGVFYITKEGLQGEDWDILFDEKKVKSGASL